MVKEHIQQTKALEDRYRSEQHESTHSLPPTGGLDNKPDQGGWSPASEQMSVTHVSPIQVSSTQAPVAQASSPGDIPDSFEDIFLDQTGDKRIKPQPLNKPSVEGQVQQMITLTDQKIRASGGQLKEKIGTKQQQFDNQEETFRDKKLGFTQGGSSENKRKEFLSTGD